MKATTSLRQQHSIVLVAATIFIYWVIAMTMVFINKHLISGFDSSKDITVFIVWFQTLVGVSSVSALRFVNHQLSLGWDLPVVQPKMMLELDMLLASMFFTGTLLFNNLMLKYISVAFYQLGRSLTLIFVIITSAIILKERISWHVVVSCLMIILGFYIGVDEEMFSQGLKLNGVFYGIAASLTAALCGVFYKRFQIRQHPTSLQLTFNNQIISLTALTSLLYYTSQINEFMDSPMFRSTWVFILLLASGFTSVAMGVVSAKLISLTSPLTHNITINSKSVLQTLLAVLWSGQARTANWWIGNAFVVAGIATYTANKMGCTATPQVLPSVSSSNNIDLRQEFISNVQTERNNRRLEKKDTFVL